MKNLAIIAVFLLIPSVSSAAALTTNQANSLIAVVQSSTTTPASAFVPLITAFSNITVPQAESLIAVIQQAPGVAPSAFVNMLIAFTVDAPIINQTPILGNTTQPTQTQPVIPTSTPAPTETTPAPVVQSAPMDKSGISVTLTRTKPKTDDKFINEPFGAYFFNVAVLNADGHNIKQADVHVEAPDDLGINLPDYQTNQQSTMQSSDWTALFVYRPSSAGTKTITFTSGSLTKTYDLIVI